MRTLIITLGSGRRRVSDGNFVGYLQARYRFPGGFVSEPTQLFGLALFEWLRSGKKEAPDRLVILGTPGSIWGAFCEYFLDANISIPGVDLAELTLELDEKTQANKVGSFDLGTVEQVLGAGLGLPKDAVLCRLIPVARNDEEQREILTVISESVPKEGVVDFDLTHGLRHLPLLQLMSALHLVQSKAQLSIGNLYYGALELSDRTVKPSVVPVIVLNQVKRFLEWRDGVRDFERHGDVEQLCRLLGPEGKADAKLREALLNTHFFLETNQAYRAGEAAAEAERLIRTGEAPIAPEGKLFRDSIYASVAWARDWEKRIERNQANRNVEFARAQLDMAEMALKRRRYQRCIVLLLEAIETSRLDSRERWDRYNDRVSARDRLGRELADEDAGQFKLLNHLRNQLAHTVSGHNREVANALESEENLRALLLDQKAGLLTWVRQKIVGD